MRWANSAANRTAVFGRWPKCSTAWNGETSKEILNSIEGQDANLVETIRHLMFVFEDILLIDPTGLKEVLARVDRKQVTMALKGTADQLKNHFLQCMSQRGAEMVREDMDAMGPVKIKEVEAAQRHIISNHPASWKGRAF